MDFKCTSQRLIGEKHKSEDFNDRHEFKFVARNDPESKLRIISDSSMAFSVGSVYEMTMEAK